MSNLIIEEIYDNLIDELIEGCINELRKNPEYNKTKQELMQLDEQYTKIIFNLPKEQQEICEAYSDKKNLLNHDIYKHLFLSKIQMPLSLRNRNEKIE